VRPLFNLLIYQIYQTKRDMKREQRFQAILSLLDEKGHVEVDELADHFDVSPETVRRDLSTLSEQALLRKVHGGAVKFQTAQETSFTMRSQYMLAEKVSIATHAAQFVKSGDSLLINGGTTTAVFARKIAHQVSGLVVITNSPPIANEFWNKGENNHRIYLLGGYYDGAEMDTLGVMVVEQIQQFQADHAFLTVGTVSAKQGFMDYRMEAAQIMRAMMRQARHATVLADSGKLGRAALVTSCSLADIDKIVTDSLPPDDLTHALEKAGTHLYVTQPVG
jgi:DeoR family transcriptional regulator, glycerol-3-phosphate regulon repressor